VSALPGCEVSEAVFCGFSYLPPVLSLNTSWVEAAPRVDLAYLLSTSNKFLYNLSHSLLFLQHRIINIMVLRNTAPAAYLSAAGDPASETEVSSANNL
jgi:hypothetical protein